MSANRSWQRMCVVFLLKCPLAAVLVPCITSVFMLFDQYTVRDLALTILSCYVHVVHVFPPNNLNWFIQWYERFSTCERDRLYVRS